jgi:hypothetical protein
MPDALGQTCSAFPSRSCPRKFVGKERFVENWQRLFVDGVRDEVEACSRAKCLLSDEVFGDDTDDLNGEPGGFLLLGYVSVAHISWPSVASTYFVQRHRLRLHSSFNLPANSSVSEPICPPHR